MKRDTPRLRIAPTPSGYLHLGNGVNFVLTVAYADYLGGALSLRIDDLDAARVRPAYLDDIRETLEWLLPDRAADLWRGAVWQSSRRDRYDAVLTGLRQNRLAYACDCTRKTLAAYRATAGDAGAADVNAYPGRCRSRELSLDAPNVVWRTRGSDIVVRQKNGQASYQIASLVDDVDAATTHLVRGGDLRDSTRMQRVLAGALSAERLGIVPADWPDFGRFPRVVAVHHPLVVGRDGDKLSKSAGAASLRALRTRGGEPSLVMERASRLLGLPPDATMSQLGAALVN